MAIEKNRRSGVIATITTLLLIGITVYLTIVMGSNERLANNLRKEKLASETSLSEKLAMEKEVARLNHKVKLIAHQKSVIENDFTQARVLLQSQEAAFAKNNHLVASLWKGRKQNEELKAKCAELEKQLNQFEHLLAAQKKRDAEKDEITAKLQQRNKDLNDELAISRLTSMNAILIETHKRNGSLTADAKRTKKISISLEVPQDAERLKFTIVDPSGNELPTNDQTLLCKTIRQHATPSPAFYAAANVAASTVPAFKKMEVTYQATQKLTSGIYTIFISNDGLSIGSLQVRLK